MIGEAMANGQNSVKPQGLDRSRLKLDLKPANGRQISVHTFGANSTNENIVVTPLSAPARSHFFLDQAKGNAVLTRRGLEAWKRALASAAPGTTMCFRNRDKSPIESLQRVWEEKKKKDESDTSVVRSTTTTQKKSVSFLLLRKPASSIRRFYQRATTSTSITSPWRVVNAAFNAGSPSPKSTNQIDQTPTQIRTTEL